MSYPIVELPADAPEQLEQLGTKTKFWYHGRDGRRVLFKEGRPGAGENWAGKVCCELCRKILAASTFGHRAGRFCSNPD